MITQKHFRASLLPLAISLTALATAPTSAQGDTSLELSLSGVRAGEGVVRVGLYDSETGWNDSIAITGASAAAEGEEIVLVFDDLAPGRYGIKLYQDLNDDNEINMNFMGIPTEPYAFSNNAQGRFGPASWSDAHFEITTGSNAHAIRLN